MEKKDKNQAKSHVTRQSPSPIPFFLVPARMSLATDIHPPAEQPNAHHLTEWGKVPFYKSVQFAVLVAGLVTFSAPGMFDAYVPSAFVLV